MTLYLALETNTIAGLQIRHFSVAKLSLETTRFTQLSTIQIQLFEHLTTTFNMHRRPPSLRINSFLYVTLELHKNPLFVLKILQQALLITASNISSKKELSRMP